MKNINIAFIGAVGVPNNYGGFEMFLDACGPELSKHFGEVIITCERSRYSDRKKFWRGVRRVFIPISANGGLSIVHDLFAFFAVFFRVNAIVVLGISGGIFFPLFRLLCGLFGKKLIVNVDGIEWRRAKFSRPKRVFLYACDRLAQKFSHMVIVDNEALRPFLIPSVQESAVLIAYPGDHVQRVTIETAAPVKNDTLLTICRIEPENNCHLLIEAFARSGKGKYIFVGNWQASVYGRDLREKYADMPGLELRDPVYDADVLSNLRESCAVYLHGHSVGGTNPSLVEMLFYDCEIIAFDCAFNRSTAGSSIQYFADERHLSLMLSDSKFSKSVDRSVVRAKYTRSNICADYSKLIINTLQPSIQDQGSSFHTFSLESDNENLRVETGNKTE